MNIGIAQINTIVADVQGNMEKAKNVVKDLSAEKVDMIVFSELFTTGYPPRDLLYRNDLIQANLKAVEEFKSLSKEFDTTLVFGYVEPNDQNGQKKFFNSVMVVSRGEVLLNRRKTLLPTYDVFVEERYFEAGKPDEEFVPFELNGKRIGVIICEEAWNDTTFWDDRIYSFDPVSETVNKGVDYIVCVNASPYKIEIPAMRRSMLGSHAKRHKVGICYVNQVGFNDDVGFDGSSFAVNNRGQVIMMAPAFSETHVSFSTDNVVLPDITFNMPWQQEVILALQSGVRDYFKKLGIKGPAIIGLSGGIDSALVAFIAATALGKENVIGVGMPSEFSSEGSRDDAEKLANKLGIDFAMEPIGKAHDAVRLSVDNVNSSLWSDAVSAVGATGFAGAYGKTQLVKIKDSGVTDENIQARIRGVYLMALANYYNGIVLSTGNKSELAVGYCTIYGDMCGGLAVISDLMKTKVFDICNWINKTMMDEIIPWDTINKPPSAELRADQEDQQTLPPYSVLDEILTLFVEQARSPEQIAKKMLTTDRSMKYRLDTGRNLEEDIYWVCQTVVRNEFKRKQAPTGIKLTSKLFRSGWEQPIVHKLPVHGKVKQEDGVSPSFPDENDS